MGTLFYMALWKDRFLSAPFVRLKSSENSILKVLGIYTMSLVCYILPI